MKTARIAGVAALLAAAGAGYWLLSRPMAVAVVKPKRGEAAEVVYATGIVEPRNWAKVTPLIRERIVTLCDCEGATVERGDVLARLDSRQAEATLAELKAREELASAEHGRLAVLVERNAGSVQALQRARSEIDQAKALVAGQAARLESYVLRAPAAGIVLRQDGEVGEIAEPGTILFWVGDTRPLRIVADVNEEDIPRVRAGQRVLVSADAFPGRTLEATVDSITPKGDPVTKTYRVYLALPEDTPLLIGMTADLNIVARVVPDALLLPTNAVSGDAVFVLDGSVARRREVRPGIRGANEVEIVSGLAGDARVIVPYPERLADGAAVRLEGG